MSDTKLGESSAAGGRRTDGPRFHPIHAAYAAALLVSALAVFSLAPMPRCRWEYMLPIGLAFSSKGLVPALLVLAGWGFVFYHRNRRLALGQLVLIAFVSYCVHLYLLPPINASREAARRTQCTNNLKCIGLALRQYSDKYGSFPPACTVDHDGNPQHSWRVLILPFLEEQDLYDQYRFDEPWNGPTNQLLLKKIPHVYQCPTRYDRDGSTRTSYLAVIGFHTMWPHMEARSLGEVTDPLDNTLLVLEADPEDVEWLEPRDILFEDAMEMLETVDTLAVSVRPDTDFFYHCPILNHPGGRIATLADGSPMFFTHRHSVDYWKSLLTIDDGITPDPKYRREPRTPRRLKVGNTLRLGLFLFLALLPLPWVWLGRPA